MNDAVKLMAALDDRLPEDCVRIAAAHPATAALGAMFGAITGSARAGVYENGSVHWRR